MYVCTHACVCVFVCTCRNIHVLLDGWLCSACEYKLQVCCRDQTQVIGLSGKALQTLSRPISFSFLVYFLNYSLLLFSF